MDRRLLVGALAVAAVVAGAAFATGVGPAPGGESGSEVEDFPTATATPAQSGGETAAGTTAETAQGPAFVFTIDRIEECGQTCRDVTGTVANDGDARATGVVVYTRVFVGNGTDGDVVWSGEESVGRLDAGETHTATRRVELSYSEGMAVQSADGWITIQTTVESDQRTVTFTEQRQVA